MLRLCNLENGVAQKREDGTYRVVKKGPKSTLSDGARAGPFSATLYTQPRLKTSALLPTKKRRCIRGF